jgi:transcriptional regulator with XRE-family HTH domain
MRENLANLRKSKGYLKADVARKANITEAGYSYYEQGKRTPSVRTAIQIASALGVQSWKGFCELWDGSPST